MKYEKDLMASWDEYATKQTYLEEGREKGIEQGREEGREEIRNEIIKNLITKAGFSDAKAADIAGVSVAFVKKIRRKHQMISDE